MRFLRTNTAVRLTVGPFFDKTDGVTPETAITVTSCKLTLMVDDGNVPTLVLDVAPTASGGANDMVHVTGDDAGFYDLELAAANLNYVGRAMLAITDAATHCPVFHEFMILPAMVYDSLVLGTDVLQTDVTQLLGTAWLTPGTAGTPDVNVKLAAGTAWNSGAIGASTLASDTIAAAKIATDAFTAAKFAAASLNGKGDWNIGKTGYALSAAGVQAIWDALTSVLTTVGSIGKLLVDNINATISSRSSHTAANVRTEMDSNSTQLAAIVADTNELQGDWVNGGRLDLLIDGIKTKTDFLPSATAGAAGGVFIAGTNASLTITGQVLIENGVKVTCTTANRHAVELESNGSGSAISARGGDTSGTPAVVFTGAGANGHAFSLTAAGTGNSLRANGVAELVNGLTLTGAFSAIHASNDIRGVALHATQAAYAPMLAGSTVVLTDGSLTTAKLGTFALAKTTNITGFTDIDAAGVRTAVGLAAANLDTQLADIPTVAEFEARTLLAAAYGTAANQTTIISNIAALNNLSAAQVNAEVLDVLNVDTFAEPGQEAPAATNTIRKMLAYLFKAWRNKSTETSTTYSLYNDAGATVDQKSTNSDDGATFTSGEVGSGP